MQHLAPDHKSVLTNLVKRYPHMQVYKVKDGKVLQPNCAHIIRPNRDMALLNGTLQLLEPTERRGSRLPIYFFFRSLGRDQHELRIGRVDGSPPWARLEATATQHAEHCVPVCRAMVSDITERKRAEPTSVTCLKMDPTAIAGEGRMQHNKRIQTKSPHGASKLGRAAFCLLLGSVLVLSAFACVFGHAAANLAAMNPSSIETLKTIIVDDYAPYTFVDADGQPAGFSVDLMQAVAQVMDFKLDIQVDTWEHARQALENGEIDFLPMMAYSEERDKAFDFSAPHTIAYDVFFTRKDASPIHTIEDLHGKTIIVMEGDQAHDYLSSIGFLDTTQLILVDSLPQALQLLASGSGDTALMPKLVGLKLIKDLHLTNLELAPVVVEAYDRHFCFAVKAGNQVLLERLSQGLNIVKATGQYDEIYQTWFGALEPRGPFTATVLKYLGGIILVSALLGAIPLVWSFSLRKQVAVRTRSLETEIQERKRAEGALKEQYTTLRSIIDSTNALVFSVDRQYRYTSFNKGYATVMKVLYGAEIEKGHSLLDYVTVTADREATKHNLDRALAGEQLMAESYASEEPRARQHFQISHSPIKTETGEVIGVAVLAQDMTARKRAEEALRKSAEKYRTIFEESFDGLFVTSPGGKILDMNKKGISMFGCDTKEEILSLDLERDVYAYPPDRKRILAMVNAQGTAEYEVVVKKKSGEQMPAYCALTAVKDEHGTITAYRGIIRDITERKQAEEALRESEAHYRTLFETAPVIIYTLSADGILTALNPVFEQVTGWSCDEWVARPFVELFYADDAAFAMQQFQRVLQGAGEGKYSEMRIQSKAGAVLTVEVVGVQQIVGGQVVGISGFARDITQRKRAEEALAAERALLRTVVDHLPDGVYVKDVHCRKTLANPADLRNMGATSEAEALGKTDFDFFPHDLAAAFYADDQSVIQSGRPVLNREEIITLPDGSRGWLLTSKVPVHDSAGQVVGLVGIGHDITERKRAEEEIRQHAARLEALRQVSLNLAMQLDLNILLHSIVERAVALVGGQWGYFELYQPDLDALVPTAVAGHGPDLSGALLQRGEGLAGKVWESGEPLLVDDYQHWEGRSVAYDGLPIRAMAGVPVRWGDEFLGVLEIEGKTAAAFTPDDADLLSLFTAQAAIAIHNARLFETERAARQQAEKLQAATQALSATLDLQQVFERILTELRYVVPYDSASVQELKDNRLEIIGGHGYPNLEELLGESFDLTAQDNPNREVVRTKAPLILDDAPAHYEGFRREPHAQVGVRAWLGVPMLFGDRLIGLITLDKQEPGFYTEEHARLAMAFAVQAAIAITNARLYREAVQAARRREVLHWASEEIVRALHDPEQVYQAVHQAAAQLMPTDAFAIVLRDEACGENEGVYLVDKGGRWPVRRIPAGQGLSGQVIAGGRSLLIPDFGPDVAPQAVHFGEPEPVRSILAVPLRLGEKVIGMISAQSYQPEVYTTEDKALLEMLAAHTAATLENTRLYQETEQRLRELSQLFETSTALATSLDLDTVLRTIALHATTALGAEGCAISAWDRERDALVTLLDYSPDPDWWQPATPGTLYPLAQYPASHRVLTDRQPLAVQRSDPDADAAEMAWMKKDEVVSLLMVPLVIGDRAIGMLELMEAHRERPFAPNEIRLCQTLANEAAAALENARLYDEAQRRNRELTLLNRVIAASATSQAIEPILEVVCRELALAFEVPQAAAALFNEERTEAVVVAEYLAGGRASALGETTPVTDNPAFQHLLIRKAPLVIDDAQADPRLTPHHDLTRGGQQGTISLLLLPLIVDEEVVGSLELNAIELRPFAAQEVALAQRVAEQVSGALVRARLEQTQRRLSMAIEQAAESIVITDAKANILYANPAFEQSSGYSLAEVLGQHLRILRSDKHDAAFYTGMWQVLRAGQIWQGQMVNRRKDGAFYTVDSTITPVRDRAGEIVNYIATLRDVTRELQLEEQFRQAQKMEAIGRLAGGVAHDFNNLLTVIHLSTRLLERQLRPQDPLWQHVQRIQDASQRAANLTRQLLAFSRREIVEPQVLNLNQVLGNLDKMLRRLIGEDVELTLLPAGELWPVKIDPTQVEQVVVNLAVNARDAMPIGGKLTIETANVALGAAYAAQHLGVEPGQYVMLAVSDTGQGMTEEVKAHLFEPFFTTKEKGKGTGLGLATVFGIVKQNGGHIGVYSEVERGTTFKIYLPRVAASTPAPTSPPRAAAAWGTETLLLVEDESQVRELARDILQAQGYQVLTARDGVEALQVAEAHEGPIHLLLTDVVMPRLSGKALADRLLLARPEMRVLFTSGYTDNAIVHHGVLAEGIHFLSKPFELEALARKVREVLDTSERPSAEAEKEEAP